MVTFAEKTGIQPIVIEEIKEIAKKYGVQRMILFEKDFFGKK